MIGIVLGLVGTLAAVSWFLVDQFHQYRRLAALALALDSVRDRLKVLDQVHCGCLTDRAVAAIVEIDRALERAELADAVKEWKASRGGSQ